MITMVPLEETVAVQQIVARKLQQAEVAAQKALLRAEKRAEKRAALREKRGLCAIINALEDRLGQEKSEMVLLEKLPDAELRAKFQSLLALITVPNKASAS